MSTYQILSPRNTARIDAVSHADAVGAISNFACCILVRLLLDAAYLIRVMPRYSYLYGFVADASFESVALSWVVLLLYAPLFLCRKEKGSICSLMVAALFIISFIPMTTLIAFENVSPGLLLTFLIYWINIAFADRLLQAISLKNPGNNTRGLVLDGMIVVFSLSIVYISWHYTDFRISLDISSDVYYQRMEAREFDMPTVLQYVFDAGKVVTPLLIVYLLNCRKNVLAVVMSVVQILAFSVDGSKATLFYLVFVLVCYFFVKKVDVGIVLKASLLVVLAGLVLFGLTGYGAVIDYGPRRIMLIPAQLNLDYYDFFSRNTIDFYRQSIFSKMGFPSAYSSDIARLIGLTYHGSTNMNANNGLYADAYANLGVFGCFMMPYAEVFILKLFEAASDGLQTSYYLPAAVMFLFVQISSSFFTALITHGLIFIILALYLFPRHMGENSTSLLKNGSTNVSKNGIGHAGLRR